MQVKKEHDEIYEDEGGRRIHHFLALKLNNVRLIFDKFVRKIIQVENGKYMNANLRQKDKKEEIEKPLETFGSVKEIIEKNLNNERIIKSDFQRCTPFIHRFLNGPLLLPLELHSVHIAHYLLELYYLVSFLTLLRFHALHPLSCRLCYLYPVL